MCVHVHVCVPRARKKIGDIAAIEHLLQEHVRRVPNTQTTSTVQLAVTGHMFCLLELAAIEDRTGHSEKLVGVSTVVKTEPEHGSASTSRWASRCSGPLLSGTSKIWY